MTTLPLITNSTSQTQLLTLDLFCLAYRLKEFIKEQLIAIPMGSRALVPAAAPPPPPVAQPPSPAALADDPGAMLAGLL